MKLTREQNEIKALRGAISCFISERAELRALVRAVKYNGKINNITCENVDNKNWFTERKRLLGDSGHVAGNLFTGRELNP
jgi:hypothetical protein